MAPLLNILAIVFGIGSIVCWIMVLIKMFSNAGVVQGILGILCGIWAFIWGWMHASEYGLKNIMIAWTVFFLGGIAINAMTFANNPQAFQVPGPGVPAPAVP